MWPSSSHLHIALRFKFHNKQRKKVEMRGTIKMFNGDRGFGFIKPADGGIDVFFHVLSIAEGDDPSVGQMVDFEVGVDPKSGRSRAISVMVV
jgi:cold shock protein